MAKGKILYSRPDRSHVPLIEAAIECQLDRRRRLMRECDEEIDRLTKMLRQAQGARPPFKDQSQ